MIEYTVKVYSNGDKSWWLSGKLHRTDGPAIEYASGSKEWWLNGNRHREDGPAVECANGNKSWYLNDKLHRTDGPATEYVNGDKLWYLNGKEVTEQEVMSPTKELTIADIEKLLGHKVKVVK